MINKENILKTLQEEKKLRKERAKTPKKEIGKVVEIGIDHLEENPFQPRVNYPKINELAENLKKEGQIQPITITPKADGSGKYVIVAGHRRTKAAKKAGIMKVKAIIVDKMSEMELKTVAMAENIHRVQLQPSEIVIFIKELQRDNQNITNSEISKILGISTSAVSNYMKASILDIELLKELDKLNAKRDILVTLSKVKDKEVLDKAIEEIRKNPKIKIKELEKITKTGKKRSFELKVLPTSMSVYFGVALNKKEKEIVEYEIKKALTIAAKKIKEELVKNDK